jgi:hypothetical protein
LWTTRPLRMKTLIWMVGAKIGELLCPCGGPVLTISARKC